MCLEGKGEGRGDGYGVGVGDEKDAMLPLFASKLLIFLIQPEKIEAPRVSRCVWG